MNDRSDDLKSDSDLAIERALEAANLRAGDALGTSTGAVLDDREPSAVEAGDVSAAVDGD
ncbi:hypothetical protein [Agromyces aerolatus]|uniref:hypothetical protein n=1 Tax=Agromyces sp. LY-1074 TaxID=3074080 RepID=UPI00285C82CC|nr:MULTISPECIES: hypothetical protein [unclassified Agromyces]MDR5699230.1 hypothetical protein [Agromyces sp. LY-1074]MDR5705526.1 hypothetical protein [Agromyces sp. LY-1358]